MSRKEGQKRKLLVLLEILARETDEKHPLSVPQLVEKLQEHGVVAERKSVYDDLNTLNNLPDTKYEIVMLRLSLPSSSCSSMPSTPANSSRRANPKS